MTYIFVRLPPGVVSLDNFRYPNRDDTYVFDHLLYYCSFLSDMPAINILLDDHGNTVVTRGHLFLKAALQLNRPTILAMIDKGSNMVAVHALLHLPSVIQLDWRKMLEEVQHDRLPAVWHVYFFERSLLYTEKLRFTSEIAGFFDHLAQQYLQDDTAKWLVGHVSFDNDNKSAVFQTHAPVGDERWYGDYLLRARRFSEECVRIISFQGRRFQA